MGLIVSRALKRPVKKGLTVMGICALPTMALAEYPFITDDSGVQGAGGSKLELAYDFSRSEESGAREYERTVLITYTRGLTDVLDAQISVPWQSLSATGSPGYRAFGNTSVGLTWRFYDNEQSGLSLALKPKLVLPVSNDKEAKGIGSAETAYGLLLVASQETAFGELNFNLEAAREEFNSPALRAENRPNIYRISLSPIWSISDKVGLGLDVGVQTNPDKTRKSAMGYIGLALAYMFSDDLRGGLGIGRDVSDGAADTTSATLGMVWYFH
jgi:hypothetical protein